MLKIKMSHRNQNYWGLSSHNYCQPLSAHCNLVPLFLQWRKAAAWTTRGNDIVQTMKRYYSNTLRHAAQHYLPPPPHCESTSRDCLMKTNPFVAVHCWKALSLRIVSCPLKSYIWKGHSRIVYKVLSVYRTFAFESAGFLYSIEFGMQHTFKVLHFCK